MSLSPGRADRLAVEIAARLDRRIGFHDELDTAHGRDDARRRNERERDAFCARR